MAETVVRTIQVNERVRKIGGDYSHTGRVAAIFQTAAGNTRCVVEFEYPVQGMLHIFRLDQLELA